jgi:hypothetical protein
LVQLIYIINIVFEATNHLPAPERGTKAGRLSHVRHPDRDLRHRHGAVMHWVAGKSRDEMEVAGKVIIWLVGDLESCVARATFQLVQLNIPIGGGFSYVCHGSGTSSHIWW